jgi:siroheme synthase-like protein
MSRESAYMVAMELTGKPVWVVGGGAIATRKVSRLLEHSAHITLISPQITPRLAEYAVQNRLVWLQTTYQAGMLAEYRPYLVFATTDDPTVNQQLLDEARALHIWVNSADSLTTGDFTNVVQWTQAPITIGISTGGASPALALKIREEIGAAIGQEYSVLAEWLGALRQELPSTTPDQPRRAELYLRLIDSDILLLLRQGHINLAHQRFNDLLQVWQEAHP